MSYPQEYTIASRDLRIVFERRDDRWAHRVELISSEAEPVPLFESVEGAPTCSAPPSPPIQELQMHGKLVTPALLGVGMAGRNHWSLTCGFRKAEGSPADEDSICMDVACRVKDQTRTLSSQYRLAPRVALTALDDATIQLDFANRSFHIRPHGAMIKSSERGYVIHPCDTNRTVPRTVRWSYTVIPTNSTADRES